MISWLRGSRSFGVFAAVLVIASLLGSSPGLRVVAIQLATSTTAGVSKRISRPWYFVAPHNTSIASTNIVAATAEYNANRRALADLTGAVECRLCTHVAAAPLAGLKMCEQYSLDAGSTFVFMDGTVDGDCGAEGPQTSLAATGQTCSAYTTIAAAAAAPVLLRLLTDDGDGAIDTSFISAYTECR